MEGIPLKLVISPERLRWSVATGASALIALLCAAPAAPAATSSEVIVRFAAPTTVDQGSALVEAAGGQVTRRLDIIDGVGAVVDTSELGALRADSRVLSITPNARIRTSAAKVAAPIIDYSFLHSAYNQSIKASDA